MGYFYTVLGLALSAGLWAFLRYQNNHLTLSRYVLPELDSLRIVHLSDLHGKHFGKNDEKLLKLIESLQPDIIVFTGDMVYKRNPDISRSLPFVRRAARLAPFYFVSGNHEHWNGDYEGIVRCLCEAGAVSLEDRAVTLPCGVTLVGGTDGGALPEIQGEKRAARRARVRARMLPLKSLKGPGFNILLSHRPELTDIYNELGFDLVLCGHAHGGQFRLPFVGAVFAPGQGLFPKYTEGLHRFPHTTMIVSRGLGGSLFPFRLFNYPEVLLLTGK